MELFSLKREKREKFLVLDVGTEALKTLILEKAKDKVIVSAAFIEYFDNYSFSDVKDFEAEIVKKAISETFGNLEIKKPPENVFLGLPADILRGKIAFQPYRRKNYKEIIGKKESEAILEEVLRQAKKTISQILVQECGILEKDIHFISLKVLEIKIDGYQIPTLQGYSGENLVFRLLITFLLEDYFRDVENIAKTYRFKKLKMLHLGQSLSETRFLESENSIFLDIGGKITQIFLIKDGKLMAIETFEIGGAEFSQSLSYVLGQRAREGRELKERYSKKLLSIEIKNRISEILSRPREDWYESLKKKIKEINTEKLLPPNFFLFGGGSQLPEIQEVLEEGLWQEIRFMGQPNARFIYPKDFMGFEDKTGKLNTPQNVPPLLLCRSPGN